MTDGDKKPVIALAGNPNVGKSTVFNALTGMKQHTGNWPGKTIATAQGVFQTEKGSYTLVDIPGTYSLLAHSEEERVARDFICFGESDAVFVVCDATCLERNLNLVLQTLEVNSNAVICINLMDEAKRKNIKIDIEKFEKLLGVRVIGISAHKKKTVFSLARTADSLFDGKCRAYRVKYPNELEIYIEKLEHLLDGVDKKRLNSRWLALRLLERDPELLESIDNYLGYKLTDNRDISALLDEQALDFADSGLDIDCVKDMIVSSLVSESERICGNCVKRENGGKEDFDRRLDRILTGKLIGYPLMLLLLAFILWLTISGANYPSQVLSGWLFSLKEVLRGFFVFWGAPAWLEGIVIDGIYHVLAWVVSVMLPPMAIFFPLFTFLEDVGYLPRIAYNLDAPFQRCNACGKQALTMCMGFGCNSVGIVGCRIIDSGRERLLASLTNAFVPCNGKFPTLIAIITIFFAYGSTGISRSVFSAVALTILILLGVVATFLATKLLSKTLLRGEPSSFTLELPPYRPAQIGKIIVRSVLDRTLFVLARAVTVAAPAGALIWLAANITVADTSLLSYAAASLDGVGRFFGLDGVILIAFILGLPANEIVIPIMIMAYTCGSTLDYSIGTAGLGEILEANGWTEVTALCMLVFMMFHWPCATSLMTLKRETKSIKWTVVAAVLPTLFGLGMCLIIKSAADLLALI